MGSDRQAEIVGVFHSDTGISVVEDLLCSQVFLLCCYKNYVTAPYHSTGCPIGNEVI